MRSDSEDAWREASPLGLYAVSKFVIVQDPKNRIHKLQQRVRKYYPEKVWKEKILKQWIPLLDDGKYNVGRDLKRKKTSFMLHFHLHNALWDVIILGFLFNRKYYSTPHQWLYEEFKKLLDPVPEVVPKIEKIIKTTSIKTRANLLSGIINIYANHLRKHKLIKPEHIEDWRLTWK